jgi:hypothetical protein
MAQLFFIAMLLLLPWPGYSQFASRDGASSSPTDDLDRINVGDTAPDFHLENFDGAIISLSDFRGIKNIILVFYRGHW